jgi:hypothetical protein
MKKIIIISAFVFISSFIKAQDYWFKIIPSDYYQGPVSDIIISNNQYYFSAVEEYNSGWFNEYYSFICRVTESGEYYSTGILNNTNINLLGTSVKLDNDNLLAIGHYYLPENNESFALWQVEYDLGLQIINEKIDNIDIKFGYIMNSFKGYSHDIYFQCAGNSTPFAPGTNRSYLARLDQQQNIIIDTLLNKGSFDFAPYPEDQKIIIQSRGLDDTPGLEFYQINVLDTNFMFISTPLSFIPDSLGYFFSIEFSEDSNYYFSGMRYAGNGTSYNSFAASKANIELQQLHYQSFDTLPYWHFTPDHNGIDSYRGNVYVGGNYEYRGTQQPYPNYFTLTKMDTALNIINQHYYGGDKNYLLNTIKTTPEGDVLLLGRCSELDTDLWNIFIMKVDENGLITSTKGEPEIPIKNAIITPNPGKDYMQLHTGIYPAQLQIFNINGQLVLEEVIQKNVTTIQTQSLSSGTFVWQLLKDGKVVETDKWVKE